MSKEKISNPIEKQAKRYQQASYRRTDTAVNKHINGE